MILFDPDQPEAAQGFPNLALTFARATKREALPSHATLTRYLRQARRALDETRVDLQGEVTVMLTTDAGIRSLNRRFRKKDKATDVLSFPVEDPTHGVAGDIAISIETAARQAMEHEHALSVEVRILMLHGLLHLAGFDHDADDGEMAGLEGRMRALLRLPAGLIERTTAGSFVR